MAKTPPSTGAAQAANDSKTHSLVELAQSEIPEVRLLAQQVVAAQGEMEARDKMLGDLEQRFDRHRRESGKALEDLQTTNRQLQGQLGRISRPLWDLLELRDRLAVDPSTPIDADAILRADQTVGELQSCLSQLKQRQAAQLAETFPALKITKQPGLQFGSGVWAPHGMVYTKAIHPAAFAQIVAQHQRGLDYDFCAAPTT